LIVARGAALGRARRARGRGELGLSGWENRATRLKKPTGRAAPGEEAARVKKPEGCATRVT